MTNQLTLDPYITARCDLARELAALDRDAAALLASLFDRLDAGTFAAWLLSAAMLGLTVGPALARSLPPVLTGYQPTAVRRSLHHRVRADGIHTDPPRDRSGERARCYHRQLFAPLPLHHCERLALEFGNQPVLACEVAS